MTHKSVINYLKAIHKWKLFRHGLRLYFRNWKYIFFESKKSLIYDIGYELRRTVKYILRDNIRDIFAYIFLFQYDRIDDLIEYMWTNAVFSNSYKEDMCITLKREYFET